MLKQKAFKFSVIFMSLFAVSEYANADDKVNTTSQTQPSAFSQAFYDDAKLDLNANLYIRHRSVKDDTTGKYGMGPGGIRNQTGLLALNYRSGYFYDIIGFDFWGGANIKLGHTKGQSEILHYKYHCNGQGQACEESFASVSTAALKLKLENENAKFNMVAGYTPINSGTIRSSWGLNPHAFRGFESAVSFASFDNFTFTYAWADRFKNDWSKTFKRMTNKWHQNASGFAKGETIDYIHTAGIVYKFDKTTIDTGYGEGKDYRRNWQLLVENNADLMADTSLQTKFFYQGARYIAGPASGITDPSTEYYATLGLNLKHKATTVSLGYSQNKAPQTNDYNFRLTPWANSDKRDYQATLSQLEDYNAAGTHAIRLAVSHNFADFNLPELTLGLGGTYGWHVVTNTAKVNSEREYDGKMRALDFSAKYTVLDGPAKGLSATLLPALLRTTDTNYKTSRNDVKFVVGYSINIF